MSSKASARSAQGTTLILAALTAVMLFMMGWLVTQMGRSDSTPPTVPSASASARK